MSPARWFVLVVVLIAGCGQAAPVRSAATEPTGGTPPAVTGPSASPGPGPSAPDGVAQSAASEVATPTPAAAPACARIERPPLQSGSHLLGGQKPPVPYSSHPPTSGWHSSGHFDVGVNAPDDPLSEPDQVSVLEAEGVVVAYGALPDAQVDRLARRVRDRYRGRVAATPYAKLGDGEVAFTAWGVLQRCDGVDLAALDRFVDRFATDEPIEPGH